MVAKRLLVLCVALAAFGSGASLRADSRQQTPDRVAWVGGTLARMLTIKPGMTRGDLLKVFTTEGGLSAPLERTYVSRDCLYFKVHVTFRAVGRPQRDESGREINVEDLKDVIVTISKPFLEYPVMN